MMALFGSHGGTEFKQDFATTRSKKDDLIYICCDKCGVPAPLMFDVHKFRDDITGRWENPAKIFKQMHDRKYQCVVCKCIDGNNE